ncbi:MAG: antibiotic biosynthesis monooxygenase [Gammaproteobacteria bacterium]|nr:antibiotic biosynthesis monooxygenase [Gammaproteobacteria bacterium]
MYVVVFRATLGEPDEDYRRTAERLRELALGRYGCLDFSSCTEDGQEIAVSYWPDLASIHAWRDDPEHRQAKALGMARWYRDHRVDLAEVVREP